MLFRSASYAFRLITRYFVCIAAMVAIFGFSPAARATLYWDANSSLGGNGNWDVNSTVNWSTTNVAGAPNSTWTPNDGTQDAAFNGGASYTVTIPSGTINTKSIALGVTAGNVKITGGAINISDPANSIVMNTGNPITAARAQVIQSPISGTDITVVANAVAGNVNTFLELGSNPTGPANTFTGDLIFGGTYPAGATGFSQISIENPNALPTTATVRMKRNQSQLLFGGLGAGQTSAFTATFNNNIILNDGGSGTFSQSIGAGALGSVITLGGVISGNSGLIFQLGNAGGQGKMILTNHETYTGSTQINTAAAKTGIVALGIDNVFPIGTTFSSTRGNFDMAGFNQQVGGLTGSGGNGVISNTSATTSTLTISGSLNGDFSGLIGNPGGSVFPGGNDNVALTLGPANTGSLTLSNANGNTYNGGTTISGGKIYASNDSNILGSATGTGPVTVGSGGTLGGTGSVGTATGGAVTVGSGGHLTAGARTGANIIGTLIAFNAVTLNSGSNLDIDVGAPAPAGGASDQISLNGFFGNFPLNVPAAAHSVGVNFGDPAGGAAGNGTYTLMTFQPGTYTGSSDASPFYTASSPTPNSLNGATIAYHLADASNTIQDGNPSAATKLIAQVTGGPNALVWTGGVDGAWDTGVPGSPFNFTNVGTGSGSVFAGNDNVTFNDTGANTNPITVAAGGVQPNIITISNSTSTYTFSGGDIKGSSVGGTGGMYLGGTGAATINNNYTAAGPITVTKSGAGTAAFNGAITAATGFTVNGGAVTLAGANTFTGNTTVTGGSLTVSGASSTFGAGNLTVSGGSAVISAGVANAIANSATLTLAGGGTANTADVGFINLATGINEQVASLILGSTTYTSGTFGATGSAATNIFDEYFSGAGIITVVSSLLGDYNHDGRVNAADYVAWRMGSSPNPNSIGDYNIWRANFGAGAPGAGSSLSGATPVPEPGAITLVMLTASAVWLRTRKTAR